MSEKWIDVSSFQKTINWAQVKSAGVSGAIIRAGYGNDLSQKDPMFDTNMKGAIAAGLQVAVYWFSYADSPADAQKEWYVCQQIIAPYKTKILFVAFDYEEISANYYAKVHHTAPSPALINSMANAFLSCVRASGFVAVLYLNNNYRKYFYTAATLKAWPLWLADYTGGPDAPCLIQQSSSSGQVPGVPVPVDTDILFVSFVKTMVQSDTGGTLVLKHGGVYQLKTTCATQVRAWSGSPGVIVIPRYNSGNSQFWYIVAIGNPGDGAGIFTSTTGESGLRRFIVNIK